MFSIDEYMTKLTGLLRNAFGARLLYVGLQGSYQRGEAGPQSDIDVMVVLDTLSVSDLGRYRVLLKETGEAERQSLRRGTLMKSVIFSTRQRTGTDGLLCLFRLIGKRI